MRGPKRNSSLEETNRFVYISAEICAPHDRLNANRSQSPHGYGSNFIRSGSGRFGYGGTGAGYSTPATSLAQPPTGHQQMNNLDSLESYDSGVGGFGKPTPPSGRFWNYNKLNIFPFCCGRSRESWNAPPVIGRTWPPFAGRGAGGNGRCGQFRRQQRLKRDDDIVVGRLVLVRGKTRDVSL